MQKLEQLAYEVVKQYPISEPKLTFIRHNENYTCKVTDGSTGEEYVLRIHIPIEGFSTMGIQHSYSNLYGELTFLKAISQNTDISVQKPVNNKDGLLVSQITDQDNGQIVYVTLLTWIKGEIMSTEGTNSEQQAYETGVMLAKLHNFTSSWEEGRTLDRIKYDAPKMISAINSIEEAIGLGLMDSEEYSIIQSGGMRICELMEELERDSFGAEGLIHADMQNTNLIVYENTVTPIDFCGCGHGYFYIDFGCLFASFNSSTMRNALLDGYRSIRKLPESDMKYIEASFVMVILLCMSLHLHNPKMREWYLRRTKPICDNYIVPLINNERFYENI